MHRLAGIAIVCAACAAAAQSPINEARVLVNDYRSALTLAQQAASQNDQTEYQKQLERSTQKLQEALRLFQEGNILESEDAGALRDYAGAQVAAGATDLAARALARATKFAPRDAGLWFEYGAAASELGPTYFLEAKNAYQTAIEEASEAPLRASAQASAGLLFFDNGYYPIARSYFKSAANENPENPLAQVGVAAMDVRDGALIKADATLNTIGSVNPALNAKVAEMLDTAIQGFWEARIDFPDTVENHLAYARILVRANYPASAAGPLKRVVHLDGENTTALNMLGGLLLQLGDRNGARAAAVRSLEINDDQPRTKQLLQAIDNAGAANQTQQPGPAQQEQSLPVGIAAPPQN